MYHLQLVIVRILLNLFSVNRDFVNDVINAAKPTVDISSGKAEALLLSWFSVKVLLVYRKPCWGISIAIDDEVLLNDKLTNGRWCFNRSTLSRLETLFGNHYHNETVKAVGGWLAKDFTEGLANMFSLTDRLIGRQKDLTLGQFPGMIQQILVSGITRQIRGTYLIDNMSGYVTAHSATGPLEELVMNLPVNNWKGCVAKDAGELNRKIQTLLCRNLDETLLWSKLPK